MSSSFFFSSIQCARMSGLKSSESSKEFYLSLTQRKIGRRLPGYPITRKKYRRGNIRFKCSMESVVTPWVSKKCYRPMPTRVEMSYQQRPWLLDDSQLKIVDIYEAEITGKRENDFQIEFRDAEMEIIEAFIPIREFKHHPISVSEGTHFGIVLYNQKDDPAVKISVWPTEEHWNPSLLPQKNDK